jgi:nitroreductase
MEEQHRKQTFLEALNINGLSHTKEINMSGLTDMVKSRRSIRRFQEKAIPDDVMNELFETVRWSQSWANTQCWEIINVKNPEKRQMLQNAIKKVSERNPGLKAVVAAPVLLAICAKKGTSGYYSGQPSTKYGDWLMFDLGIATQTLCLAAHSLGLGTVVLGLYDHDMAAEILGLPDDYAQVVLVPLGYPDQSPKPPERKSVENFVHTDIFGRK